jgi:aminoglycoside phosphotransferase (APT) family kinase protein
MDSTVERIRQYMKRRDVLDHLGWKEASDVSFLAQGEYNINYLIQSDKGGKAVFRLNTASQLGLENQIRYEYRSLQGLAVSGVTPEPLYIDDSKEHFKEGLLIMQFLRGRPLDYEKDLEEAARLFAKIHALDTRPFKPFMIREESLCRARIEEGRRWLSDYQASPGASRETLWLFDRLIDYCEKHVHHDTYFGKNPWWVVNNTEVNSHNFIIGEEGSYMIDWEKPVISDPVQDISQFLAPTTTLWRTDHRFSKDEIDRFFNAYDRHSDRSARELRERELLYRPFLYLRALSWCAHAWVDYSGGDRTIVNERTRQTIQRYLEPDFMRSLLIPYIT